MHTSKAEYLQIDHFACGVTVLGPGSRTVIWVQGCPFACAGCISPEARDPNGGERVQVDDLVGLVTDDLSTDGLTFSGGEPMEQAGALTSIVRQVRSKRDIGVMCYTGYKLDYLQQHGNTDQIELLKEIDLLVDGPYVAELHDDLLWRGSSNQRLLPLTERYRAIVDSLSSDSDKSAGLEFRLNDDGSLRFLGVPASPNFSADFENALSERGISLRIEK
jgi:anaerobic ribonucleoside-triphosphate reductase activating protein